MCNITEIWLFRNHFSKKSRILSPKRAKERCLLTNIQQDETVSANRSEEIMTLFLGSGNYFIVLD